MILWMNVYEDEEEEEEEGKRWRNVEKKIRCWWCTVKYNKPVSSNISFLKQKIKCLNLRNLIRSTMDYE